MRYWGDHGANRLGSVRSTAPSPASDELVRQILSATPVNAAKKKQLKLKNGHVKINEAGRLTIGVIGESKDIL